jgi:hypothetical protein
MLRKRNIRFSYFIIRRIEDWFETVGIEYIRYSTFKEFLEKISNCKLKGKN